MRSSVMRARFARRRARSICGLSTVACSFVRLAGLVCLSFVVFFMVSIFLVVDLGCRPSTEKGRVAGRPAGVVFRGHRVRPPAKRTGEGDRLNSTFEKTDLNSG